MVNRKRSPKPCKDDEIRNPATGRCVKKTGSIGKKIIPPVQCNCKTKKSKYQQMAVYTLKQKKQLGPDVVKYIRKFGDY